MDKIEYSRGRSLNICEYSIFFILSCGFFSFSGSGGNFPTSIIGSEKYSILSPVTIYCLVVVLLPFLPFGCFWAAVAGGGGGGGGGGASVSVASA